MTSQSLSLYLDRQARIAYADVDRTLVPPGAVRCEASFGSPRERNEFLRALEDVYTLYVPPDSMFAAELGVTTFSSQPEAGSTANKSDLVEPRRLALGERDRDLQPRARQELGLGDRGTLTPHQARALDAKIEQMRSGPEPPHAH